MQCLAERTTVVSEDPNRVEDYTTAELANIWKVAQRTIARRIDAGDFGEEGPDWHWSKAGRGFGIRLVRAKTVRRMLRELRDEGEEETETN